MERITLGIWYEDDMEMNSKKITKIATQIREFMGHNSEELFISNATSEVLIENIMEVLRSWTGGTFVGCRKKRFLEEAYQSFFDALYELIKSWRQSDNIDRRQFAQKALYNGVLYRYLGHGSPGDKNKSIELLYNETWVSWSKKKEISYIEGKLYGPMIRLECHTDRKEGIDLSAFGVSRGNEEEVVYPTLEDQIDSIEYLYDEEDERW